MVMDGVEKLSPAERFALAEDMFLTGVALMRQNLRRASPNATDAEIDRELVAWLSTRPGAEKGDSPGVERPWPPKR
jgi:hypothetical protein